ncbi:hypothetical protein [Aequorivita xiaoshiensis]|uniref:Uncharacterized protein n=1 Tax=Aequorivita xiaoshiensis TaxID=2874476 RepID=A0A9X1R3U2_9FLAO|nr:hypothetical protein [Aequorivita xiaoshiensis]MCG2432220.1 hypothetical protein [Aequorivita xiaoshiensis]
MDKLIKVSRSRIVFILLLSIVFISKSCKAIMGSTSEPFDIKFKSLYEDDRCTLTINGVKYYDREPIVTERSLGIDLSKRIVIKEDVIHMNIQFDALIDSILDIQRKIELDTTLYLKDGYNVIIYASSDRVLIQQESDIYILE